MLAPLNEPTVASVFAPRTRIDPDGTVEGYASLFGEIDQVLGLGTTDPLSGDVAQWAMIVLTAYFGGRSLEKVAGILARK